MSWLKVFTQYIEKNNKRIESLLILFSTVLRRFR